MAALCNCARSSVKRALHELRERGFIDVKGLRRNSGAEVTAVPATGTICWTRASRWVLREPGLEAGS